MPRSSFAALLYFGGGEASTRDIDGLQQSGRGFISTEYFPFLWGGASRFAVESNAKHFQSPMELYWEKDKGEAVFSTCTFTARRLY